MSQEQQQQPNHDHHPAIAEDLPEVTPTDIPGLIEGRIVHYVLDTGPHKGEHRPAMIVRVWMRISHTIQLLVFVDGSNDVPAGPPPILWKTSVHYSATHE